MTPREWIDRHFPGLHGSIPVTGYVHHASRVERTLGWILWIGLALVLVAGSL
jgi:hypothetical protein